MHFAIKLLLTVFVLAAVGCGSMCNNTLDCDFHAFGGMRDRHDRVNGRVASLFDPAAAMPGVPPVEEPLPPAEAGVSDGGNASDSQNNDGTVEKSELRDDLVDKLDELDDLPKLDDQLDSSGDSDTGGFDFDEI